MRGTRDQAIIIKVSEEERSRLRAAANSLGLTISDFVRLAVLEKTRREQTA